MGKKLFFFVVIFIFSKNLYSKNELDSLFQELDNKIKNCALYVELKEARIEELKSEKIRSANSIDKMYSLNSAIYNEYKSFISDSAIRYLNYNMDIAYSLNEPHKINETSIATADIFSALGMYKEAIDIIDNVKREFLDKAQLIEYYSAYRSIYSGMGLYTQNSRDRWRYWQKNNTYRDSIISLADSNSEISLRYVRIQYVNRVK